MSIRVVAKDKLIPEKREEALKVLEELISLTRKESGNISYTLCESLDDPCVVAMIEEWESKEALDAHMNSEHFQRLIPVVGSMTSEPTRIEVFQTLI